MEPFAKVEYGVIAVLKVEAGQAFQSLDELLSRHSLATGGLLNARRDIDEIVKKQHGVTLSFMELPAIAVWEKHADSAARAGKAALEMIEFANPWNERLTRTDSVLRTVRIGAAYGPSLFQRDEKVRISNVLGQLLKTVDELCRKARDADLKMLATNEFVEASGMPMFERFDGGIQKLKR
jgi:hypothetical protein